ncbi:MAG: beta-galactosidase [Clostridia bacterium]|nr:beta-galactosidase [Clostridia bacterium]
MEYKFEDYKRSEILRGHLNMGGVDPSGERIDVTSLYLERGGKPWVPVMGEYHFVRDKRENWHNELAKLKAGGINIISTYIFWIYHEEIEGKFDFTGDRDLRAFVIECNEFGLDVLLRIGPYAHGECRNGGFPDWLLEKPFELRDNNEGYMHYTKILYEKIYKQVKGLLYKDGGNIIGIQLENENPCNAPHLARLKEIAVEVGFEVPLYTVTGWNNERGAEIPVNDVLPVFGGYPEAPWEKHTDKLPPLCHFFFSGERNERVFDDELNVKRFTDGWVMPYKRYPFATCEMGCGVEINHNRRPIISAMDAYALSLIKLGDGNNLLGYYMYKGGTNKIGKLTTLNEYADGKWAKECLTLSYDFQAPISEYGEIRPQYGMLNKLHLFVQDFGDTLALMEYVGAEKKAERYDTTSLRYCMRTDGRSGYVFISHYQRLTELSDVENAVIDTGTVRFPKMDIKGDIAFFLPFNMRIGDDLLEYSTTQPICRHGDIYFFAEIEGIKPEYKFKDGISRGRYIERDGIKIVTLSPEQADHIRRIDGEIYIGIGCNLYKPEESIEAVEDGSYSYLKWNGNDFDRYDIDIPFENAELCIEAAEQPFKPKYPRELEIGGKRDLMWKKLRVSSDKGFIEITDKCDTAQIYADGEMIADEFYYGVPWRIPARLLYGKECYLVMSEMKDDLYREF